MTGVVQRFVGPHVHRADGHWQAIHAFHRTAVGLVLRLFVRQMALAAHEQKFTAEQPHTNRARRDCSHGVFRHFDVGQQLDFLTIERDGRGMAQARQALTLQIALPLLETVIGQDDG